MNNKLIIACAGSGKTTYLINDALSRNKSKRILITSFTDENCDEIKRKFAGINGCVPSNIDILPWFTFVIKHLIKPYQLDIIDNYIRGVSMVNNASASYISQDKKECYLDAKNKVYSDKIALLAYRTINEKKDNVISRLKCIYSYLYIDEFQDFAGYDLDIIKLIMSENMPVLLVGDPRQRTYATHFSKRNAKYLDNKEGYIVKECKGLCSIDNETLNNSYRCSEAVITFASKIFPEYPLSHSHKIPNETDNIFLVETKEINSFIKKEKDVVQLRLNSRTKIENLKTKIITFGKSKGSTYENVLIYPTKDIKDAILNNDFSYINAELTKSKCYVALTRSRHKVGIVVNTGDIKKNKNKDINVWTSAD